jgi:hypothetical protein
MRSSRQPWDDGRATQEARDSGRRDVPRGSTCVEAESVAYFPFGGFYRLNVKADETDRSRFDFQLCVTVKSAWQ